MSFCSLFVFFCFYSLTAVGFTDPDHFEQDRSSVKALVFLSATCPCSQSHVEHLNQLSSEYSEFHIYGVITDEPEAKEKIKQYYTSERFKFPIIEDPNQILVQKYNALKTPHVVLVQKDQSGKFQKIYEGGVSDQRKLSEAKARFLEENLNALKNGEPLPYKQGRSLGCYIRRL